ncbi:MAG: hypothetical protein H6566_20255 [Lewinellaceae bacterium]|nr:hypothetical protein [Lewinellaceae bacterium]
MFILFYYQCLHGCTFSYDVGITACPLPTLQPTIHPACPDDSGGAIGLVHQRGAPPFSFFGATALTARTWPTWSRGNTP